MIFTGAAAQPDAFPSKTMRIVVGFSAGGGNDPIARIVAQELLTSFE
jgi:tripartite-type tricarboxylate transporter receptor subunit TctC